MEGILRSDWGSDPVQEGTQEVGTLKGDKVPVSFLNMHCLFLSSLVEFVFSFR